MTQRATPDADIENSGLTRWTRVPSPGSYFDKIDDYAGGGSPDDDTTYIYHTGSGSGEGVTEVGLTSVSDPLVYSMHTLTVHMRTTGSGSFAIPARVELLDSADNVFATFNLNPTTSWAAHVYTLTQQQALLISAAAAYGDLSLLFVSPVGQSGDLRIEISAVKFECPDVAPTIGLIGLAGFLFAAGINAAQVSVSFGLVGLLGSAAPDTLPISPFAEFGFIGLMGAAAIVGEPAVPPVDPTGVGCAGQLRRGGSIEGEQRRGSSLAGEALRGGSQEGQLVRC